jgi:hypothetical protein
MLLCAQCVVGNVKAMDSDVSRLMESLSVCDRRGDSVASSIGSTILDILSAPVGSAIALSLCEKMGMTRESSLMFRFISSAHQYSDPKKFMSDLNNSFLCDDFMKKKIAEALYLSRRESMLLPRVDLIGGQITLTHTFSLGRMFSPELIYPRLLAAFANSFGQESISFSECEVFIIDPILTSLSCDRSDYDDDDDAWLGFPNQMGVIVRPGQHVLQPMSHFTLSRNISSFFFHSTSYGLFSVFFCIHSPLLKSSEHSSPHFFLDEIRRHVCPLPHPL